MNPVKTDKLNQSSSQALHYGTYDGIVTISGGLRDVVQSVLGEGGDRPHHCRGDAGHTQGQHQEDLSPHVNTRKFLNN